MDEGTPRFRYDARLANEIELRWQDRWEREGTFQAPDVAGRSKFYLVDSFPYPSGIGLHVGHPLGYIGTDVFGRYLRMSGHRTAPLRLRHLRAARRAVRDRHRPAPGRDRAAERGRHAPPAAAPGPGTRPPPQLAA